MSEDERSSSSWSRMAGVGLEFGVAVAMFTLLGRWLDGMFGTKPWLLIVGCALGFVVGLWIMIKAAARTFHD